MYSRAVRSLLTIQVFLLAVGPAVGQGGASAPPALGCPPQLVWQQSYGGSGFDQLEVARTTSDGGFVLAGYSDSTDGDRQAVTHGRYDYWVARCDADRAVLWEKSYGGTANDILADVAETADGGFLLGGYSYSEPGGSKTAPKFGPSNREDYWVVRISSTGEQLWERSFGGTGGERLMTVIQTGDGGFALGGSSTSGAEGNKTSANFDTNSPATADFWLVRLDPEGNKLWEGSYGGSHHDVMTSVRETGDGGFVLGGYSRSPADGTRTAPGMFSDFQDFWVTKVDSNGVPVWDRAFGGSDFDMAWCMEVLPDGGIYLGGPSGSSTGQSKSSPFFGVADWWLLRLDASGALVWERAFGGVGGDELNALAVTPDGGVSWRGLPNPVPGRERAAPPTGWRMAGSCG